MSPQKILCIEDDADDLLRLYEGLDSTRFEIVGEVRGERAIEKLISDGSQKLFKAVLLDAGELLDPLTKLPQALQGEEIARKIREVRPDLPIFAVSWFRRGSLGVPVDGIYPKVTLFNIPATFNDLEEALTHAISKVGGASHSPFDGGGTTWRRKWEAKYVKFRTSPDFPAEEIKMGKEARQDYDSLADGEIGETYRRYRGVDNLKNVLIARRVIFATVFSNYSNGIAWNEVSTFLGFQFPEDEVPDENSLHENLRNFMNQCGIKWGGIISRKTLLPEEIDWLRKEKFMP